MAADQIGMVMQHLRRTSLGPEAANMTDRQLLEAFIGRQDEGAFETIVRRHASLVWGVCRRLLNHHDAEDAFQGTFLVLVRKAASIARRELLANWLYGVAYQTARKARALAGRRQAREKQVEAMPEPHTSEKDHCNEALPLLDQELHGLPEKYRLAILLCDLQGKTQKDAAAELGVPEGTLSARLFRARAMLAKRLRRRGVMLSTVPAAIWSQHAALASLPASVVTTTVRAASLWAAGAHSAGVTGSVTALVEGVLKTMLLAKLKRLTTLVATVLLSMAGLGMVALAAWDSKPSAEKQVGVPPPTNQPDQKPDRQQEPINKNRSRTPVQLGSANWRFGAHVTSLTYTQDGKHLVIAEGPHVRVLDAETGKEVRSFKGQEYNINSMALAGNKVAVTGGDAKIHLWNVKEARKLLTLTSHKNGSQNVRLSPDGRYVAATGDDVGRMETILVPTDYSVRVWDAATGKELAPFAGGLKTGSVGVFSPDSKQFAWASMKGEVHLCNLADGKEVFSYKCSANDLAFSPEGKLLACGTSKGIPLLDTTTGKEQVVCKRKDQLVLGIMNYRVTFSPRGDIIAGGSEDGSVVLWEVATGKERDHLQVRPYGPGSFIGTLAFAPDGKTLAVAPQDMTLRLWDLAPVKQKNGLIEQQPVRSLVVTPDGKTVITRHHDGKMHWWNATTGKKLHAEERPASRALLALSRDGSKIYSVEIGKVLAWDVATHRQLPSPLQSLGEAPVCIALSPDDSLLATGTPSGAITLSDLKSGKSSQWKAHKGEVLSLAFTADGKHLLSGSGYVSVARPVTPPEADNTIKLWDVQQRREIRTVGKAPRPVESLAVSPDGKLVVGNAIADDSTGMPMWDVATGKEVRRLVPYDGVPSQVAFSPNGKWLAVARWQYSPDVSGYIVLHDTTTWKVTATLRGHVHRITALAFTPDSRYLVTGSEDSTALVWDLAEPGK